MPGCTYVENTGRACELSAHKLATEFAPEWPAATKPAFADSDSAKRRAVGRDESRPSGGVVDSGHSACDLHMSLQPVDRLAHQLAEELVCELAREVAADALRVAAGQHLHLVNLAVHMVGAADRLVFLCKRARESRRPGWLRVSNGSRGWRAWCDSRVTYAMTSRSWWLLLFVCPAAGFKWTGAVRRLGASSRDARTLALLVPLSVPYHRQLV